MATAAHQGPSRAALHGATLNGFWLPLLLSNKINSCVLHAGYGPLLPRQRLKAGGLAFPDALGLPPFPPGPGTPDHLRWPFPAASWHGGRAGFHLNRALCSHVCRGTNRAQRSVSLLQTPSPDCGTEHTGQLSSAGSQAESPGNPPVLIPALTFQALPFSAVRKSFHFLALLTGWKKKNPRPVLYIPIFQKKVRVSGSS